MLYEKNLRAWDDNASTPAPRALSDSALEAPPAGAICRADGSAVSPDEANLLLLTVTLSGTDITTLHFKVVPSPDGGTTQRGPLPNIDSVSGGVVTFGGGEYQFDPPAGGGTFSFPIAILPGMSHIVKMMRTGGDGTSKALAIADLMRA